MGARLSNTSNFSLFNIPHTLKLGAQVSRETTVAELGGDSFSSKNEMNGGEQTKFGVSANLSSDPLSWLTLKAGIRFDSYESKRDKDATLGSNNSNLDDVSDDATSFNLGAVVKLPFEGAQLFANYSQGWRSPSMREQFLRNANINGDPVRPETLESFELGASYSRNGLFFDDDFFGAKVTYFDKRYTDYISGNGYFPGFANMPSLEHRGIELAMKYDMKRFYAEYALTHYTHAELCGFPLFPAMNPMVGCAPGVSGVGDAFGVPDVPETMHSLTVGARFFDNSLDIGARLTHATDTAFSKVNWAGQYVDHQIVPYTIIDLFGSYEINDTFKVNMSVENLTDRYYLDAGAGYNNAIPAPGRKFRFGLTSSF